MDISTLANLINAVAVTAGVIFAATQIRDYRRQRKRDSMLALVRSFQSPTFAKGLRRVIELPDDASAKKFERYWDQKVRTSWFMSRRHGRRLACFSFMAN